MKIKSTEIVDVFTSDEEETDEDHPHPGFITQDDIIEKNDVLYDNDENFKFNNINIKKGLEENKDFIIVNEKIWKFLYNEYGGKEIKRFFLNVNENNYFVLEIWLKKVKLNIFFF